MTKTFIENEIKHIKKKLNDSFLTMDEKTHGFYNGKLAVYEECYLLGNYSKEVEENEGLWKIDKNGDLVGNNGRYTMHKEAFKDDDVFLHLETKGWFSYSCFIPVFFKALKQNNIKKITLKTYY